MKIYNFNKEGYFVGESEADESPLEEGVFLIPANATTIEPPIVESGFVPVFNGTKWDIKDVSLQQAEPLKEPTVEENKTQAQSLQEQMDTLSLQMLSLMGV